MPSVADLVEADLLAARAGEYLQRAGEVLSSAGRVRLVSVTASRVTAEVTDGDERHKVELAVSGEDLAIRCDCPTGGNGRFCPHSVGVAIATRHGDAGGRT